MSATWKLTALAPRCDVEAALLAHEDRAEWDPDIVVAGSEVAEDRPDEWRLEAWLPRPPTAQDRATLRGLFTASPPWVEERLPEIDFDEQIAVRATLRRYARIFTEPLRELNLGASAVGTGLNAGPAYTRAAIDHLSDFTGLPLRPAAEIAISTVRKFTEQETSIAEVIFCCFSPDA